MPSEHHLQKLTQPDEPQSVWVGLILWDNLDTSDEEELHLGFLQPTRMKLEGTEKEKGN